MASDEEDEGREGEVSCFSRAARWIRRALSRIHITPRSESSRIHITPRSDSSDLHGHFIPYSYEPSGTQDSSPISTTGSIHPPRSVSVGYQLESLRRSTYSSSIIYRSRAPTVGGPPRPQNRSEDPKDKTEEGGATDASEQPESEAGSEEEDAPKTTRAENTVEEAEEDNDDDDDDEEIYESNLVYARAECYDRDNNDHIYYGGPPSKMRRCHPFSHHVMVQSAAQPSCSITPFIEEPSHTGAAGERAKRKAPGSSGASRLMRALPPAVSHQSPPTSGPDPSQLPSEQPDREAAGDGVPVEAEPPVPAVNPSAADAPPARCGPPSSPSGPGWGGGGSGCLPRSHSLPSLSPVPSAETRSLTAAESSPALLLTSSCEEFTPVITADEKDEAYRFPCCRPGLYQCSVTGLLFHMEAEGDVVYRTVPWDRMLLAQHHKQPAGPLFDITCEQRSVRQLQLPHCEIASTGGCRFLSVAHVHDDAIEFMAPREVTDTHVVVDIATFSAFGNVKDQDSPPDPVRALVLLFYRPPADPLQDPESLLNVLMLPRNVVLQDVKNTRRKLVGDELYVETSPHCKLQPRQEYTLTTSPGDESVLVQPAEAEFDCDDYDNYFPSFQVSWETVLKHMRLFLRDSSSSHSVWERRVGLPSAAARRSCRPSALNGPPDERLLQVRSSFINGISGPVLKSLLDKLLEKSVLAEAERESVDGIQNLRDKARSVMDTVRKKGAAACSLMVESLCELDPVLCEHLGLL